MKARTFDEYVEKIKYLISYLSDRLNIAVKRDKYAICAVLSAISSLLSVANPLLSALIVKNIKNNFNFKGIIPSIIALIIVKGTRMLIRGKINKLLREGDIKAPLEWMQKKIKKYFSWLEPMIEKWGFIGEFLTNIKGGIDLRLSAAVTSFLTDFIIIIVSGIIFYFTGSYTLTVVISFLIPTLSVIPIFNKHPIVLDDDTSQKNK